MRPFRRDLEQTVAAPTLAERCSPLTLQSTGDPELDGLLNGGLLVPGSVLLWGDPGAGKTRLALRLGVQFGPTLLVGLEMGRPLYQRYCRQLALPLETIRWTDTLDGWLQRADGCGSVIVDSLSESSRPLATLRELCRSGFPGIMLVVCQQNARGRASGGPRLEHIPDTTLVLRSAGPGLAHARAKKHRGGPGARSWAEVRL